MAVSLACSPTRILRCAAATLFAPANASRHSPFQGISFFTELLVSPQMTALCLREKGAGLLPTLVPYRAASGGTGPQCGFDTLPKGANQLRIRVTQRDIDEGVQGNSFHCPVARAVKRAFKAAQVWVREVIIVTKAGSQHTYVTPLKAQDFLEWYDSAILEFESPRPFSFTLDARQLSGIRPVKPGIGARARRNADQT